MRFSIWRWCVWAMCAAVMGARVTAEEAVAIRVGVGAMQSVEIGFEVKSYSVAKRELVKVEQSGARRLLVTGLQEGATDLQVMGEGAVSASYRITVEPDVDRMLRTVKSLLEDVPGIQLSKDGGHLIIQGEVSHIEQWNTLKKVEARYSPLIDNYAKFHYIPDVLVNLQKSLEAAGFKVVDKPEADKSTPGTLALGASGLNIIVSGQVFSRRDLAKLEQVIASQRWLVVDAKDKGKREDTTAYAIMDVSVAPVAIELDVAFIGVSDADAKQIGANIAAAGLLFVKGSASLAASFVRHGDPVHLTQGQYEIGSSMDGALKFFGESKPGRFRSQGHLSFLNGFEKPQVLHSGGTLKVRVTGRDVADLKDIDYGLKISAKGDLTDAKNIMLDLDIELSTPFQLGADYDLKRNRVTTQIACPLGHTMVLGGSKELFEGLDKNGVPYLRNVPVLKWFFSEENQWIQERKVLIMVSPHIAGAPRPAQPLVAETEKVIDEAAVPVPNRYDAGGGKGVNKKGMPRRRFCLWLF